MTWVTFGFSAFFILLGLFLFIIGIIGIYKFKFVLNNNENNEAEILSVLAQLEPQYIYGIEAAEKYGMSVEDFEKEIGSKELFKYDLLMRKAMKVVTE